MFDAGVHLTRSNICPSDQKQHHGSETFVTENKVGRSNAKSVEQSGPRRCIFIYSISALIFACLLVEKRSEPCRHLSDNDGGAGK